MAIVLIRQLNEDHIQDLCALYRVSWWGADRTVRDVRRMLAHSDIVVGLVDDRSDRLVGFARVLTDFVYRAFLQDVMIAESRQGLGLGQYLMDTVLNLPELRTVEDIQLQCLPDMVTFYSRWDFSTDRQGTVSMGRRQVNPS
jgi:GNAT superfamily N-acetyltransferase